MELAEGECKKIGEKWPTIEFKAIRREKTVPPSPSKSSNPPSATRRSRLLTGVVGPFRAWKLPLGTCTKNRRITSTINVMNSNFTCLALIVYLSRHSPQMRHSLYCVSGRPSAKNHGQSCPNTVPLLTGASPDSQKYSRTMPLERAQRYGYLRISQGFLLAFQVLNGARKGLLLLIRIFCIYSYNALNSG
jgi:hypothetical protein